MVNKRILLVIGIVIGSLLLVSLTKYILNPLTVLAFSENSDHAKFRDIPEEVIDKSVSAECRIT